MSEIKLYHGDCLKVMDELIEQGVKVDAVITDPPYGTTRQNWDKEIPADMMWFRINNLSKETTPAIIFSQSPFDKLLGCSNIDNLRYEWIWEKDSGTGFLNANRCPLKNHENILVFYKKQPTYNPQKRKGFSSYSCRQGKTKSTSYDAEHMKKEIITENDGTRFPVSIIKFQRDKNRLHPTQKPVSLMEYLVKTYTDEGDTVLDFTMGSGTTGVACKNLNRNFIGIELDDKYFEIAKNRIEQAVNLLF